MNDAKKLAGVLLLFLIGIAFLNRGQLSLSSGPSGASGNVAYYGLVK